MLDINKLIGNKIVKDMLFSKLLKACQENNIKAIIVTPKPDGKDFDFTFYNDEIKVLTEKEFNTLIENL